MENLKEQILKLRLEDKTYNEIVEILGCAKSLVSYYCGENQKEKTFNRLKNRRQKLVILHKVENFQNKKFKSKKELTNRPLKKKLQDKTDDFQRERIMINRNKLGKRNISFKWQQVIEKFGWNVKCYLTGRDINLKEPTTYHFDHVIPISKGGSSTIDNLGIVCCDANMAKGNLLKEDLLILCKEILEHNGYSVKK